MVTSYNTLHHDPITHFIIMAPPVRYYPHRAGRDRDGGIGPVYAVHPFHQRGYAIGSYLSGLWRAIRPILSRRAKTAG